MILFFLFLFLIGVCVGSFLNVVIDRMPRGESIVFGHSHCDMCKKELKWYDLVPLFSFLVLAGRCRYCHRFIGWKYPIIESLTGMLFVMTGFLIGMQEVSLLVFLGIISSLLVIFFTDYFSGIIPDYVLIALFCFTLMELWLTQAPWPEHIYSSIAAGLFFLALYFLTKKRGMGLGDVKYAFVMGLLLGFPSIIVGLYLAFLTGALLAIILVVTAKKTWKAAIPFGPFLVIATYIGLFWGENLWTLLLKMLGM